MPKWWSVAAAGAFAAGIAVAVGVPVGMLSSASSGWQRKTCTFGKPRPYCRTVKVEIGGMFGVAEGSNADLPKRLQNCSDRAGTSHMCWVQTARLSSANDIGTGRLDTDLSEVVCFQDGKPDYLDSSWGRDRRSLALGCVVAHGLPETMALALVLLTLARRLGLGLGIPLMLPFLGLQMHKWGVFSAMGRCMAQLTKHHFALLLFASGLTIIGVLVLHPLASPGFIKDKCRPDFASESRLFGCQVSFDALGSGKSGQVSLEDVRPRIGNTCGSVDTAHPPMTCYYKLEDDPDAVSGRVSPCQYERSSPRRSTVIEYLHVQPDEPSGVTSNLVEIIFGCIFGGSFFITGVIQIIKWGTARAILKHCAAMCRMPTARGRGQSIEMASERVNPAADMDPAPTGSGREKYLALIRIGVPVEQVKLKMLAEGFDPDVLDGGSTDSSDEELFAEGHSSDFPPADSWTPPWSRGPFPPQGGGLCVPVRAIIPSADRRTLDPLVQDLGVLQLRQDASVADLARLAASRVADERHLIAHRGGQVQSLKARELPRGALNGVKQRHRYFVSYKGHTLGLRSRIKECTGLEKCNAVSSPVLVTFVLPGQVKQYLGLPCA